MSAITYEITDNLDHMRQAEYLQKVVWGATPEDTLSATTMRWMIHIGGSLIGAWDGDTMIGFVIASVGQREGKWILWSDMTGVHPEYQGQGIGYQLKQLQKKWAYEQGYEEIRWTFDPMRRGNAYFNFNKLGIQSSLYHQAFYGHMNDDINRGLPADRLEAVWSTDINRKSKPIIQSDTPFVVSFDGETVQSQTLSTPLPQIHLEIPYNLDILKSDNPRLAKSWQSAIAKAFIFYFAKGYQAIDFHKTSEKAWYTLDRTL